MACVSTVSFSVLVNGNPSREFRPSRGLRQGDSLSPCLFILSAEVLSNLMRNAVQAGSLHRVRVSTGAPLVRIFYLLMAVFFSRKLLWRKRRLSLMFCDDMKMRRVSWSVWRKLLFLSVRECVSSVRRSGIANRLGVMEVEEQARYFGLPTVVGRSKKVLTYILRDKLSKRLQGSREKILFRVGNEVHLKAVANSLLIPV
ncbi:uncharacterized protein LOC141617461 [Silene latifolia]|uniref:uncharacterized protein LOC141617461 n=1 Tax=Silene latifolia TaxID=37657 RepID=UPI003D77E597